MTRGLSSRFLDRLTAELGSSVFVCQTVNLKSVMRILLGYLFVFAPDFLALDCILFGGSCVTTPLLNFIFLYNDEAVGSMESILDREVVIGI